MEEKIKAIRQAIADYMYGEGCSCCSDPEQQEEAAERLAELLDVPQYSDGSGYDFYAFRTGAQEDNK